MLTGIFSQVIGPSAAKFAGWVLAAVTMIPLLAKVLILTVHQDEEGYILRNGKPVVNKKTGLVRLADPGTHFVFPILKQIRVISKKEVTFDPAPQTLTTKDGVVMDCNMSGQYRRLIDHESMTQAILKVEDPQRQTFNLVMNVIAELVRTMPYDEVIACPLREMVLDRCNPNAQYTCGVEVTWIGFQSLAKSDAQLHYEGQVQIARAIRDARSDDASVYGIFATERERIV